MKKQGRPTQPIEAPPEDSAPEVNPPRILASLAILWHLSAVIVAPCAVLVSTAEPLAFPPGGGPPFAETSANGLETPLPQAPRSNDAMGNVEVSEPTSAWYPRPLAWLSVFEHYLDALYLNHGYSFFAPDPGPSHLLRYQISMQGGEYETGKLPDASQIWPRLLYHRYFMLAEQTEAVTQQAPSAPLAIAEHLTKSNGAERALVERMRHRLLWPVESLEGVDPQGAETYLIQGGVEWPPAEDSPPVEKTQ